MAEQEIFAYEGAELVFGLVAPVGADIDKFMEELTVCLEAYKYRSKVVRLSDVAESFEYKESISVGSNEFVRLTRCMDAGNSARTTGGGGILALAAAAQISDGRIDGESGKEPLARTAHVLRSLKHPEEVWTLRRIYGPGFFLVGIVTDERARREYLMHRKGCTEDEVTQLFKRDEREDAELGQRTRDAFHLADVFVDPDDRAGLERFVRLVFGYPYETPTRDEYAMFMAFSASLRSADLSRQVGAAVTSSSGDIVAVGANDVPSAGGGLCWPGVNDQRDHVIGHDTNEVRRTDILDEILDALVPAGQDLEGWRRDGRAKLRKASVMDITEYGRAVHAEMEALLSCARSSVSPQGATLYSTTFPCHNCAKHIVAAGVVRVVYVEPYPKSQALTMYPAAIRQRGDPEDRRVLFERFQGVGPRRFLDLFSVGLSSGYAVKRKGAGGSKRAWDPAAAEVRAPLLPNSYISREQRAAQKLADLSKDEDPS